MSCYDNQVLFSSLSTWRGTLNLHGLLLKVPDTSHGNITVMPVLNEIKDIYFNSRRKPLKFKSTRQNVVDSSPMISPIIRLAMLVRSKVQSQLRLDYCPPSFLEGFKINESGEPGEF